MADDRGRRRPRAGGRDPGRGDRVGPARLLDDPAGRLCRGQRRGRVPGGRGRRPAGRRAGAAAAGRGRRPVGPAGGGLAGRAAARGGAVRARPGAPVPGRRRLLRLLERVPAGHADAVPAGARARPLAAALAARRGRPLRLGPPVPADLRVPVRAGQLHRPRGPARGRGPRPPPGAVGRPGRPADGGLRRLPAARLVPVAAGPPAPPGPRGAGAGAVDLDRLRPVPDLAERVRADRRHPADRPGHPLDRLGGPRLPDRDDARPAGRPGRVGLEHDLAADRAARPARRRGAARQRPGAGRDRRLRRLRPGAGRLGHPQPLDPRRRPAWTSWTSSRPRRPGARPSARGRRRRRRWTAARRRPGRWWSRSRARPGGR